MDMVWALSYEFVTLSGTEKEYNYIRNPIIRTCNQHEVRIHADAVINHITQVHDKNVGTGGNKSDAVNFDYPFHTDRMISISQRVI